MDEFLDRFIDIMCNRCSGTAYINDKIFRRGFCVHDTNLNMITLSNGLIDNEYFKNRFFNNFCLCYDAFSILNGKIDTKNLLDILLNGNSIVKGNTDVHFHDYIKPTLFYFYKNRNEIFLRHGLEKLEKLGSDTIFPPINSFRVITDEDCYPIEIDRIPFGYARMDKVNQCGFCSNHDWNKNWNLVKGFITLKDFDLHHGKIINVAKRDHLYARSVIDIHHWYFIYQGVDDNDPQLEYLRSSNVCTIDQRLLSKFFKLFKLLHDKIAILNLVQS
jgi:hypothetical protein